ncbi:acetyl-CoA synthetase-like protein [Trametes elegans]|nr:acetyl-CoA synthetase-like protein [Trametes elegans]
MAHFMVFVLERLQQYAARTLIRPFEGDKATFQWGCVTYQTFLDALKTATPYWTATLTSHDLKRGDIVGMWLKGSDWSDLVHIYAVAAAGLVPELFGPHFTAGFVQDLLYMHAARVLVFDSTFMALITTVEWQQSAIRLPSLVELPVPNAETPTGPLPQVSADDVAIIFHTSGTTGGRPKPVPQTHKWIIGYGEHLCDWVVQGRPEGQYVFSNIGSFTSFAAGLRLTYLLRSGASLAQSSGREIQADEFLAMIKDCGLNCVLQYAPWLEKLLIAAREREDVRSALRKMRQIAYTGATLSPEHERWALEQGIPLTSVYAITECGPLMVASLGSGEPYLRLPPGAQCRLLPTDREDEERSSTPSVQLYDFFVSAELNTCPHPSVRNRPDGHVTGDLFAQVKPGCYVFRGRSDDWIRTGGNPAFCDTKAIEENVRKTCGDFVHNCVVVGHQRVCPVLVVEPESSVDAPTADEETRTKQEILLRTAPFNERLFPHERIVTPLCVLIVSRGSLPRTDKGNIRRKATEDKLRVDLERIYSFLP